MKIENKEELAKLHFICDFDGTLVRINAQWRVMVDRVFRIIEKREGKPLSFPSLKEFYATNYALYMKYKDEIDAIVSEYEADLLEEGKIDIINEWLWKLSASKKWAIVSNNSRNTVERVIENKGVEIRPIILGREDVTYIKPNPEGIIKALSKLGVAKERVISVGDRGIDEKAAIGAGIKFAYVDELRKFLNVNREER